MDHQRKYRILEKLALTPEEAKGPPAPDEATVAGALPGRKGYEQVFSDVLKEWKRKKKKTPLQVPQGDKR